MFKINPYRPGAGLMPIYLAGRDDDLENIDSLFMAMTYNIPVQSVFQRFAWGGENGSNQ